MFYPGSLQTDAVATCGNRVPPMSRNDAAPPDNLLHKKIGKRIFSLAGSNEVTWHA